MWCVTNLHRSCALFSSLLFISYQQKSWLQADLLCTHGTNHGNIFWR